MLLFIRSLLDKIFCKNTVNLSIYLPIFPCYSQYYTVLMFHDILQITEIGYNAVFVSTGQLKHNLCWVMHQYNNPKHMEQQNGFNRKHTF